MELALTHASGSHRLLLLVRHGKAAPNDSGLSDIERILTETGIHECEQVFAEAKAMKLTIDLMLSSPADRALETAHLFARHLSYPAQKIQVAEWLYTAGSIRPLVSRIRHLGDGANTVAIVGHNPLFNELAAYFIPGFSRSIPTGAVVGIGFKNDSWPGVGKGRGQLAFSLSPSDTTGE